MTRDEAIEALEVMIEWGDSYEVDYDACKIAIEALKQEPCGDAISRQAVLDVWHTSYSDNREENEEIQYKKIAFELPSVNPQEPKTDVLDKIRAEIIEKAKCTMNDTRAEGLYMALNIVEKYKAESEE